MQTRLLHQTRWRLALWYAAIMGLILSLCGFAVYEVIIQAHLGAIDRELESVTGTLHDSIEPNLKQPGYLERDGRSELSMSSCWRQPRLA